MKLRQARKIMKNIRSNPRMESLYGIGRAMKANAICVHHYARVDRRVKDINIIANKDPLLALKLIVAKDKRAKEKGMINEISKEEHEGLMEFCDKVNKER